MDTFRKAFITETTKTTTENNANAFNTTGEALLDFFAVAGSLRNRNVTEIHTLFEKAYKESPELTAKMLFYMRDIRGGLGEREVFRELLNHAGEHYPDVLRKNIHLIPEYGRWDDLYALVGTQLEDEVWKLIENNLKSDQEKMKSGDSISLMAKWLPSVNASSSETVALGKMTAKKLKMREKEYRKTLSSLRKYLDVTERKMSAGEWDKIDYSKVPSQAMSRYNEAFARNDFVNFDNYIEEVRTGESKINTGAIFPHEILLRAGLNSDFWSYSDLELTEHTEALELMWRDLPDYVEGTDNRFLIMADTSGSMEGTPLAVSIGLAIYFSERAEGAFKNLFMTFSDEPTFHKIEGKTLKDKVSDLVVRHESTNLELAFQRLLEMAVKNRIPANEMPTHIVVISDGEIDAFTHDYFEWSFVEVMRGLYLEQGYVLPRLVLWNVDSRNNHFLAQSTDDVMFLSGSSPSSYKHLIEGADLSAIELMINILDSERYKPIQV